ncbi:peptide transporter [Candidatus Pelagibacter sp.]|nr:peptide transporter [Candidatus Pelagibacter sp.]MDC3243334.1 peptide transporter [Candidatus Pelagibacter sp.]
MLGLDQDIKKKLLNLLNSKQYTSLEFEIESRGNIDEQHPLLIMLYASSKTLNPMSKIDDLIKASRLYEKVYLMNKKKDNTFTFSTIEPLLNMIYLSFRTKIFRNVLPLALEAFKHNKLNEKLIEGLAIINILLANYSESIKYYKLLFQINERRLTGRAPLLCCLNYVSGTSQEYYFEECLKYSKILERNLITTEKKQVPKKNTKIKIAFLSSDLRVHSVSFFLKDLFLKIDKKIFEIIVLSNLDKNKEDSMSEALKKSTHQWHGITSKPDIEVVNLVKSLDVDILIDLNGLTEGNRVNVMANRCAPIQICWLGYNNSTGLKNMDYLIADNNLVKKDEESLYSEKILYLPKIWNAFSYPAKLPSINQSAKKDNLLFSYGSFNNFAKISDDTIEVWSRIVNNSNSRIYLKNSQKEASLELTENLIKKFKDRGVQENKVIFLETEKNINDHLNLYNKIDLSLDTFPYPGVTTSFESVLMGVPVLTMKGHNLNSRCGESININLEMENFIAKNKDDYFDKAIFFQNNLDIKKNFGNNLRNKALSSPLFDTENFTKDFTETLKKVYLKHMGLNKV